MIEVERRELKYRIGTQELYVLKDRLAAVLRPDPHNGGSGYAVRSLYFDSLSDSDFEDKTDGYDCRQKIRMRVYGGDAETIRLECKEKEGVYQRKRALLLGRGEAERMTDGEYAFLAERQEPFARWLYTFLVTRCYRPKCVVEYDRLAYIREENDIRITLDANLRATEASFDLFDPAPVLWPVCAPSEVTLEVKYSGFLFSYIRQILNTSGRTQISSSKYCRARMISKSGRR